MDKTGKKRFKKITKWVLGIVLALVLLLVAIPFVFKDKIVQMVTNTINNNINATASFKESDLSLFRNFPLASVRLEQVAVINKAPFKGDTLFAAEDLRLNLQLTELFKSSTEPLALQSIATKNAKVFVKINKDNQANYDIAINKNATDTTATSSTLSLDIQAYTIENGLFSYEDAITGVQFKATNIAHTGKGNFANDVFDLNTTTTANISVSKNNTNYIQEVPIRLDAVLGLDLKNSTYTFKENTGYINQLPLAFNGSIKVQENQQLYDMTFTTPTSSFKNALALLPKEYAGNLNTIQTSGNFNLDGSVNGVYSETTIPKFNITLISNNARFKYEELPKAVENIRINATVLNKTGLVKDTYVAVNKLGFKIDNDEFAANGTIANLTTNPKVAVAAKGSINLANIGKVYPLPEDNELAGLLTANVTSSFSMDAIERKQYQSIDNAGTLALKNFKYASKEVANPFFIDNTSIKFNPNTIALENFKANTGASDLAMNGQLDNFYGFLFNDEVLKGNFTLQANQIRVADFVSTTETNTPEGKNSGTTTLKIPSFLDARINAKATTVLYDNIALKNVTGTLRIQEENITLQNLQTDVFGGKIGLKGAVSTQKETPTFNATLDLSALNITETFKSLDMLKSIAPIADAVEGKISSKINVAGVLNNDMTPNISSISGDLFGKFLEAQLKANNSKVLKAVGSKVDFLDISKIDLNKISTLITFKDGNVDVNPFTFNYKEVGVTIGGTHGFNNSMNYNITFNVPVKYLGTDVNKLLAKLTPKNAEEIKSIPVNAKLTGSFSSPNFSSNISQATSNLMKTLVEKQKQQLKDKGKDKLKNLLGIDKKTDSIKKDSSKTHTKVKNILGGLFGKKKKDSVK